MGNSEDEEKKIQKRRKRRRTRNYESERKRKGNKIIGKERQEAEAVEELDRKTSKNHDSNVYTQNDPHIHDEVMEAKSGTDNSKVKISIVV
jgi:hypothetical protein